MHLPDLHVRVRTARVGVSMQWFGSHSSASPRHGCRRFHKCPHNKKTTTVAYKFQGESEAHRQYTEKHVARRGLIRQKDNVVQGGRFDGVTTEE